ncbi:TetR/AcrR family transcriptional regulator [Pseudoalteromonas sp. MMG013]|uniref:HTH tetR-type domain-containing protein n=1 Tax=Pseudoalteromonas aurantia 208 TaxID=1314867 RepID=A0ABR9E9C0_9GAMM|nr:MULTISPECIES: TetR/AcrR family transcriptional regulator [Pseudoalteromonas]MBE0367586.1 hypothetical protein [Pseudoalteromonas aurantia 208]MBQ4863019.1 TetR/AcrR family transcriptional regulator [Pseudoalteromonas sp. MMG013]
MRSAEFDKEYVLRQAMTTFMQYGYNKTSMQMLTKATGLHPGSIYCAFKNKKGLLLGAIQQYQHDRNRQFETLFSQHSNTRDALHALLEVIVEECLNGESGQVCLLTKTLTELVGQDHEVSTVLAKNLNSFENSLASIINTGIQNKEVTAHPDAQERAQFLAMGIYGIRTYAATRRDKVILEQLSEQLLRTVLT